ncbi:MAG: SpoIIE family protein phosphatase [Spirochaetales bacterium]|nr:SpoIIE family protein phosphatase [Spirochaetales bacterium]
MLQSIEVFFTQPIWLKLTVDLVVMFYYIYVRDKTDNPVLKRSIGFFILLFSRDLLYALIPAGEIMVLSDLIFIFMYVLWVRSYTGEKRGDWIWWVLNSIFILFIFFEWFFNFLLPFASHFYRIYHIILIIHLGIISFKVSPHNTDEPLAVMKARLYILFHFLIYTVLLIILGEGNPVVHRFLVPASVFLHLFVLHTVNTLIDTQRQGTIQKLTGDIDSVFDFMRVMGTAITEHLEIDRVLDFIVGSSVKSTRADGGAILLVDEFEDILKVKAVTGIFPPPYPVVGEMVKAKLDNMMTYFESNPVPLGEGILGEVARSGSPIFVRSTMSDRRLVQNTRNDLQYISSLIVIPLIVTDRVLGVLAICRRDKRNLFSESDFVNIRTFADYTSLSIDNILTYIELLEKQEMEREVGIAAEIQQKLLPRKLPQIKNASIAAFTKPAKGVSGDYYDIIKLKKGKIALVMCDVAGKGVPASLVMIMIRTIIQLIAGASKDADTIVSWINRGVTGRIDIDHFATLCFLTFDTESRIVEYSNAGHHPLLLYRSKSGQVENIDTEGLPIGIEPKAEYEKRRIQLSSEDILILYTDGIIESMDADGNQYEYENLEKFVLSHPYMKPEELTNAIRDDINKFVGNTKQHDDQTLLVLKVN